MSHLWMQRNYIGDTFACVLKKISLQTMTNMFTPDEDAILGEILGTNNFDMSDEQIKGLAERCNMSYERTLKAIKSLHDKGALNLPGFWDDFQDR